MRFILTRLLRIGAVAFTTLLERKILGLRQARLGPNKLTLSGLLQPLADGVKLLTKQSFRPKCNQQVLYFAKPLSLLLIFLLFWIVLIPWIGRALLLKYNSLCLFALLGILAYLVILTGWSATSRFLKLGSLRGVLQSLSYEVALILVFIWGLILLKEFNFFSNPLNLIRLLWLFIWILLVLIEGNRAPFDLLEGESELIRGFNIEIGAISFVYIFLREYGIVLFMRGISRLIVFNSLRLCFIAILVLLILLLRSCYPRVRYDSLIGLMWKEVLPIRVLALLLGGLGFN